MSHTEGTVNTGGDTANPDDRRSPPPPPVLSHRERIATLEQQLADQARLLEQLLARLPGPAPPPPPPPAPSPNPPPSPRNPFHNWPPARERRRKIHCEKPQDYDGDFKRWAAFEQDVVVYLTAAREDFDDDMSKILFVLSYMKQGTAATWAQNWRTEHTLNGRLILFQGDTFDTFFTSLVDSFKNPNVKRDAQHELARMRQGSNTAEEFFQKFEIKRREAELNNDRHDDIMVNYLEHALNMSLVDAVMRVYPPIEGYDEWKSTAIAIDAVERRRKEVRQQRGFVPAVRPQMPGRRAPPPVPAPRQAAASTTKRDGTGVTYGGMGLPMDISLDEARKRGACFLCGETGHISRNCPRRQTKVRQVIRALSPTERRLWADEMAQLQEWEFEEKDDEGIEEEEEVFNDTQDFTEAQQ